VEPKFLKTGEDHDDHHDHGEGHDHHHSHDHGGLKHFHDEDMKSLSLSTDKALDPEKFFPWIQNLVAQEGQNILRSKGILSFKNDPKRFAFQGVHMMLDGDHQRDWRDSEKRQSRIVFIGRELPETMIRRGFEECVA
jgi:G3E family GTPase